MAKVLLVEDDNNLREIYQARLMAEGYDIVTAQNGEEALVVAKQNKPDLIISDVMMPRISGFEMLDILRNTAELKSTKVIMLTALGQAEDQARANSLGADKYLVKSQVTLEDIVNTAKQLLDDGSVIAAPSTDMVTPAPTPAAPAPGPTPTPVAEPVVTPPVPEPITPVTATAAVSDSATPVAPAPVAAPDNTTVVVAPTPANPIPPAGSVTATPATEPLTSVAAAPETTAPAVSIATPANVDTPIAPAVVTAEPADVPVVPEPAVETNDASTPSAVPAAASDSVPQSMEAEEAALQAQIDSFAKEPATPTPEVTPSETSATTATNDSTLQAAVGELNQLATTPNIGAVSATSEPAPTSPAAAVPASAPALATPTATGTESATPPATEPVATPSNNVTVAGKKIIQPISNPGSGPDLNALLAKEEAKDAVSSSAPALPTAASATPVGTPEAPAAPTPAPAPPLPTAGLDPKTVAL